MPNASLNLKEVDRILKKGYPEPPVLVAKGFPFAKMISKLWERDEDYQKHGPSVVDKMNILLSRKPEKILKGAANYDQRLRLETTINKIRLEIFSNWTTEIKALLRMSALYHDIGKYIIKERHPTIGWYIVQYIDTEEKKKLRQILSNSEELFRMLSIILRDHDQFGVLSTGEASYPILLHTARSAENNIKEQKKILAGLFLTNLADMAGSFDLDGNTANTAIDDYEWFNNAITYCSDNRLPLSEYVIQESSKIPIVCDRIHRLLITSARNWDLRSQEFKNPGNINEQLDIFFGSAQAIRKFAVKFTRICKLDYGKRFFDALVEYCEGPPTANEKEKQRKLPKDKHAKERMPSERVYYAILSVITRITETYGAMLQLECNAESLIGVELKDLTPGHALEKTAQIIELIMTSHYPGLTWMMSDVPAWYF